MASTQAAPTRFATIGDGQRAQVVTRQLLPPHLDSGAHAGRASSCVCRPLLDQLVTRQQWTVTARGAREACTQEEHELVPLRVASWPAAPLALRLQALHQHVQLTLTMCSFCGAIEVRDVSFHTPAGLRTGLLQPRRRSDVLGWYSGKRPGGRVYL